MFHSVHGSVLTEHSTEEILNPTKRPPNSGPYVPFSDSKNHPHTSRADTVPSRIVFDRNEEKNVEDLVIMGCHPKQRGVINDVG